MLFVHLQASESFFSLLISALGGPAALVQVGSIGFILLILLISFRLFEKYGSFYLVLSRGFALLTGGLAAWGLSRLIRGTPASLSVVLLGIAFLYNQLQAESASAIAAGGYRPETPQEMAEVARKAVGTMFISFAGMVLISLVVAVGQVVLPLLGFVPGTAPALVVTGMAQSVIGPGVGLVAVIILARGGLRGTRQTFLDRTFEEVARLRRGVYLLALLLFVVAALCGDAAWFYRGQPGVLPVPLAVQTVGPAAISSLIGGYLGAVMNWFVRMGHMPHSRREEGEYYKSILISSSLTLLSALLGFGAASLLGSVLFFGFPRAIQQNLFSTMQTVISSAVDTVRYGIYAALRTNRMSLAVAMAAGFDRPKELISELRDRVSAAGFVEKLGTLDVRSLRFLFSNLWSLELRDQFQVCEALCHALAENRVVGRRVVNSLKESTLLLILIPGRLNVAALNLLPPQKLYSFIEGGELSERILRKALSSLTPEEVAWVMKALVDCGALRFGFVEWALIPFLTEPVWECILRYHPETLPNMGSRLIFQYCQESPSYAHALQSVSGSAAPTTPTQPPQPPAGAPQPAPPSQPYPTAPQAAYPPPPPPSPTRPGGPTQADRSPGRPRSPEQRHQARLKRLRGQQASSAEAAPAQALPPSLSEAVTEEETGSRLPEQPITRPASMQTQAGAPRTQQPTSPPVQAPPTQPGSLKQTARQPSAKPARGADTEKRRRRRRNKQQNK